MLYSQSRLDELLARPFYQRILGAWGGRPRRRWAEADEKGCIIFAGTTNSKGYGCVGEGLVHRLAWIAFHGPIPRGMELHHRCKEKRCFNVDHLECLTKAQHMEIEGRPQRLDEDKVWEMLGMLSAGASRSEVAARFGVSKTTVTQVRRGKSWHSTVKAYYEHLASINPRRAA